MERSYPKCLERGAILGKIHILLELNNEIQLAGDFIKNIGTQLKTTQADNPIVNLYLTVSGKNSLVESHYHNFQVIYVAKYFWDFYQNKKKSLSK